VRRLDNRKDVKIGSKHSEKWQSHEKVAHSGVCDKDEDWARISAGALKVKPFLQKRSLSHTKSPRHIFYAYGLRARMIWSAWALRVLVTRRFIFSPYSPRYFVAVKTCQQYLDHQRRETPGS